MSRGDVVAVVGAGPAGLAAGWRLASRGLRVVVYEARPEAGGRLRTETVRGASADAVVQLLSDGYTALAELLEDLGLGSLLVAVPGRDAIWREGRAHALRYGSVLSMAGSAALPPSLKLRMGLRYVPFLERHGDRLDLNHPAAGVDAGLDDESVAAWGRRELGDEFVELLAYPLLAAYYGVAPEETSALFFHALARAGTRVEVRGLRGGAGGAAAAIARALEPRGVTIRAGSPVEEVAAEGSGGSGVRVVAHGDAARYDGVVVAVPAAEARRLVPGVPLLDGVGTRASAALVLALDGDLRPGWFGLSVPRTERPGARISAVCVQSEKETGLGGDGSAALVVYPPPDEAGRWASADPREVLEHAFPAVRSVLPEVEGRVIEARRVRIPGYTVPAPGHFRRVRDAGELPLPPRVALAGDYLVSPTVEGAVRSGIAAADRLLGDAPVSGRPG